MVSRRALLAGVLGLGAAAGAGVALGRMREAAPVLRVGVMTNLTHAPLLAGLGSGRIARALAPVLVEPKFFRAGPRVTEAILGGAIDVGTSGPAPVILHHKRHMGGGKGLRVLAGCASGGASLVVRRESGIARPADLRNKRLAVTQIGTTQDITLRTFLAENGLRDEASGGDVRLLAIDAATILAQMTRGELDGAWLAEPWATRIVRERNAVRLIDERDRWEGRRFATAILVTKAERAADPVLARLTHALTDEVERAARDPVTLRDEAYEELRRRVGNPGARSTFDEACRFVDFTTDPVRPSIEIFAREAAALGLCEDGNVDGLFG